MCTVSFFKTKNAVILTSNRDEKKDREKAIFPEYLESETQTLYFPRDKKALGTWFVTDNNGNTAILLNGAFKNHENNPPYKKSRGTVLLDLMKSESFLIAFRTYDLSGIEPFQLLVYTEQQLFRLLWDGDKKHEIFLDENKNYLLSSKTLYNDSIEDDRIREFDKLLNVENISSEQILHFHKEHQIEKEPRIKEIIKEKLITVSITQLVITAQSIELSYYDLIENTSQKEKIEKRN